MTVQHGTRSCYVKGCRRPECRAAHNAYSRENSKRNRVRKAGYVPADPNSRFGELFVDAGPARSHILALAELGVGRRVVVKLAKLSDTAVMRVKNGSTERIRRETELAILAIPLEAPKADGNFVDATETWTLLSEILARKGLSKAALARKITGNPKASALQVRTDQVTIATAKRVREVYEELFADELHVEAPMRRLGGMPAWKFLAVALGEKYDPWRDEAPCLSPDVDPQIFWPKRGESLEPAKAVCRTCPVQQECLDYALANSIRFGVWGGKSERERRRLRPARREAAEAA